MRHQTTAYDGMTIPRVKGMRREVRRMLAQRSRELLAAYRQGRLVDAAVCPLARALLGNPPGARAPAASSAPRARPAAAPRAVTANRAT
jgi:uncharacterized protein DUF2293